MHIFLRKYTSLIFKEQTFSFQKERFHHLPRRILSSLHIFLILTIYKNKSRNEKSKSTTKVTLRTNTKIKVTFIYIVLRLEIFLSYFWSTYIYVYVGRMCKEICQITELACDLVSFDENSCIKILFLCVC